MRWRTILILLILPCTLAGQFTDPFTDGEFLNNPTWSGDTAHFEVSNALELHLDAPSQTATSHLSTPSQAIGNGTWIFEIFLDFNPSGSNYLDLHFISSAPNPDTAKKSYFVRIGDTEDEVSLYRQLYGNDSKIIDGADGRVDQDPVSLRVKVTRDSTGMFRLYSDSTGGTSFSSEGSTYDDAIQSSSYFALHCIYTSTRSDKFYFDEFEVSGSPFQDSIPPVLDSLKAVEKGVIELYYNESLDTGTFDEEEFILEPNVGAADSLEPLASANSIRLYYSPEIPNDRNYLLRIPQVKDTAGNASDSLERSFLYRIPHPPEKGGVVINELLPDPNPPAQLPPKEYLELHAPDTLIQDLKGWTLLIGNDSMPLPPRTLSPGDRVLVYEKADSNFFQDSTAITLDQLPALTNGGEWVGLTGPQDSLIDSVHYRDDWYADPEKEDGGWSLERIDPGSPCRKGSNWSASKDPSGGTPGAENSVHDPDHDRSGPAPLKLLVIDERTLELPFDEALSSSSPRSGSLEIPDGPSIDTVKKKDGGKTLRIQLQEKLDTGEWHTLELEALRDCFGNKGSGPEELDLVLPYEARKKDLVINELLFDPMPGGVDFVEFYNRSERVLDMADHQMARFQDSITDRSGSKVRQLLLLPGEHLFLSEDPLKVKRNFPETELDRGLKVEQLPTLPNDSGTLLLLDGNGKELDRFSYRAEMHHSLIPEPEGVSLERIDPEAPSRSADNWHSAAGPEYATPGYRNSQRQISEKEEQEHLWTDPRIFTPDMDGDQDFLRIHYRFRKAGMTCDLKVHDPRGREIEVLANGELLGKKGSYTWDGTRMDGKKASVGIYVVQLECIHPEGKRILERTSCVLGTRW